MNQNDNESVQQIESSLATGTLHNAAGGPDTPKSLGDLMTLDFTDIAGVTDFYINSVLATNDGEEGSEEYRSLEIVNNGCLSVKVDENREPWKSISPELQNGKTLVFHQFGFRKANSGVTNELYFQLETKLKFGSKPDCQSINKRRFRDPETTVSFGKLDYEVRKSLSLLGYTIENTDNITFTDDGLALGPKNSPKKNIDQLIKDASKDPVGGSLTSSKTDQNENENSKVGDSSPTLDLNNDCTILTYGYCLLASLIMFSIL